jgi:hypothetical protein
VERRTAGGRALAKALLDGGVDVVIAEGDFVGERARAEFASVLPDDLELRFVTLTVPLETALVRVEQDPTRGLSRDRDFLARHYAAPAEASAGDLRLDTSTLTLDQATRSIVDWALP